jgi:hypothetical protein
MTFVQTPSPSDPRKGFHTNLDSIVEPDQDQELGQMSTREFRAPPPIDPQPWRRFSLDASFTGSRQPISPACIHFSHNEDLESQVPTVFTDVWGGAGGESGIEQVEAMPLENGVRVVTQLRQTSSVSPSRRPR